MSDATPDPDTLPRRRSPAQTEASRSNGARGRGPATPADKAASAHNAAKHGPRATSFALLPDEDAGAFEGLRRRLVEEHDPQGAVEEALVEQLALASWRTRRVEALEVEALTEARERRPSAAYAGGYNPHSPALWAPERLNTILRYRAGLERGLHRALKALAERQAARAEGEKRTNEPETRAEPLPERTREPGTAPEPNLQKEEEKGRAPSLPRRGRGTAAFHHLLGVLMLCLACLPALLPRWDRPGRQGRRRLVGQPASVRPSASMAGSRPATASATNWPAPQDMVQPTWPWPTLR